jgi:hypothetical protein
VRTYQREKIELTGKQSKKEVLVKDWINRLSSLKDIEENFGSRVS